MKKLIALVLVLLIVFSMCACTSGTQTYSLQLKDGSNRGMTAKELHDSVGTREFENKIKGATISGTGKISSIRSEAVAWEGELYIGKPCWYETMIWLDDGMYLVYDANHIPDLYDGDTVSFCGVLNSTGRVEIAAQYENAYLRLVQ